LFGDTALIGSFIFDGLRGAAHVFRRAGPAWVHRLALTDGDATLARSFGVSVSLDGDEALIGMMQQGQVRAAAVALGRALDAGD
jgi:hypothetical protein